MEWLDNLKYREYFNRIFINMDYEKKLERAKELYKTANEDQKYILESLFPELRESKEERIRKWCINLIKTTCDYDSPTSRKEVDDAIAWLESINCNK